MEKRFIIAVAALAALAACKEITIDEAPARKIAFEVASYVPQTRASLGSGSSLWDEFSADGSVTPSFYTWAYFYPAEGSAQTYMNKVQINPNATSKAATSEWAPAIDYFWPRTGYIDFFSFTSVRDLSSQVSWGTNGSAFSLGTAASPVVVEGTDNIMLADACYYAKNATDDTITQAGEASPTGVPTLFRHLLCKVEFNVKLVDNGTAHTGTNYQVDIVSGSVTNITTNGYINAITPEAKSGADLQIKSWNTSGAQRWSEASSPATEAPAFTATSSPLAMESGVNKESSEAGLIAMRAFRPQAITDASVINLKYTVRAYHDGETNPYFTETVTIDPVKLNTAGLSAWNMNDKIVYTIKINPVTNRITFDPAVETWTERTGEITL